VHGPVTALLSIRAATRLRLLILRAGLTALRDSFSRVTLAFKTFSWMALSSTFTDLNSLPAGFCMILRC
jgi:hypothetical protein